jgi:hypothetical protein
MAEAQLTDEGRGPQGGYAKSLDSYSGYAAEMNPKLKGKKVPLLEAEPEEEYVPPPFSSNAAEVSDLWSLMQRRQI